MSEAGLRQLDRDLPRISVFSPAFLARKKREAGEERRKVLSRNLRGSDTERKARMERSKAILAAAQRDIEDMFSVKKAAAKIIADAKAEAASILVEAEKRSAEVLARAGLVDGRSAMEIICAIADKHQVTVADIMSYSHRADIVAVRHEAMARVYAALPNLSLPQIAKIFGRRDHSGICHVVRKMGAFRSKAKRA